jgi:peptidoglycan/LPS O-acetylase OafA/YrhL
MPVFYAYVIFGTALLLLAGKVVPWGAIAASLVYGLNYYQGLTGAHSHFLSHCWSLAVEEQFYFLWPVALGLMLKSGVRLGKAVLLLIVCVWVYRAGAQILGLASDEYMYRALEMRADQLLIGCLLAVLLKDAIYRAWFERVQAKYPWLMFVLFAVLMVSSTYNANLDYRYTLGYVIEPIATTLLLPLLVICAQKGSSPLAWFCNSSLIVKAGQASYGIYLFHQFVLYSGMNLINRVTHSPVISFFIVVMMLSVLAHLSYTYFEMPIRRRFHSKT